MSRGKLKRLMRELGKLQQAEGGSGASSEGALPVSSEASIFLLQDESRTDVLKCLISGPADVLGDGETPYALGLFEFHIFIPPDYPNVPPLVNLQTTGDGMVRFNPNLYSDGKVCLSLLGTWHGEGWTVPTASNFGSTILQVLVSIQSIIMVKKPYFNEPGYADEEGTALGDERSRDYNENIRLQTMRFAIRDMLKKKPYGMEGVVRSHFLLLKPILLRQLARWLSECKSPSNRAAMEKAYVEIVALLEKEEGAAKAEEQGAGSSAMEIS
jgi:ubiquitin-protein ligase